MESRQNLKTSGGQTEFEDIMRPDGQSLKTSGGRTEFEDIRRTDRVWRHQDRQSLKTLGGRTEFEDIRRTDRVWRHQEDRQSLKTWTESGLKTSGQTELEDIGRTNRIRRFEDTRTGRVWRCWEDVRHQEDRWTATDGVWRQQDYKWAQTVWRY